MIAPGDEYRVTILVVNLTKGDAEYDYEEEFIRSTTALDNSSYKIGAFLRKQSVLLETVRFDEET